MRYTHYDEFKKRWQINDDYGAVMIDELNYAVGEAIDKLAAYEDAEEHGLLVRLPCRAGDRVYVQDGDQVRLGTVKNISITTEVIIRGVYNHFGLVSFAGVWGNSVFASRKEAEAALKGETEDV